MENVRTGRVSPSEKSAALVLESMPPERKTPTGTSLTLRLHGRPQLGEDALRDLVVGDADQRVCVIPDVPPALAREPGRPG